jgi:uncharacterized protein YbcV (DUF1398 family)
MSEAKDQPRSKQMDKATIDECMKMSFADTPFPQVVARLSSAGVSAYRADLIRLQNAYYDGGGDIYDHDLPLHGDRPPIAAEFREADIVTAVRAIQRSEIGYAEFLRRIMRAGCASYSVFFGGRKAMYFGRDGAHYTERFPEAQ